MACYLCAGGNAGHFRHLIAFLAERYTVFAVDLLGFGESDKPADVEYNPQLWADIINGEKLDRWSPPGHWRVDTLGDLLHGKA